MVRTFSTHKIRPQQELTGKTWEFTPCQGAFAGRTFQVATPSCWESYPDFQDTGEREFTEQAFRQAEQFDWNLRE